MRARAAPSRCSTMKAAHVKTQADEAMRDGNFGLAADRCVASRTVTPRLLTLSVSDALHGRYTTCIALCPTGERDEKLLCNRALAYLKAGRHKLAVEDAQRACALVPEWNKAWFRLGAAQAALQQFPAALDAYTRSLHLDGSKREVVAAVRSTVKRLTREQLAAWLLRALDDTQASGAILLPETEDVTQAEREEAMFRHLQLYMRDKPQPGDYYDYVSLWCEAPWSAGARGGPAGAMVARLTQLRPTGMAYIHRAAMFCRAKCYLQAAVDAKAAIAYFQSSSSMAGAHKPGRRDPDALVATHIYHPGTTSPFRRARIDPLAWAWCAAARKQLCAMALTPACQVRARRGAHRRNRPPGARPGCGCGVLPAGAVSGCGAPGLRPSPRRRQQHAARRAAVRHGQGGVRRAGRRGRTLRPRRAAS
jgi:tetratricopeptide (TPR) repeat protein